MARLANWISSSFAIKVSLWIEEWKKYSDKNNLKYWNGLANIKSSTKNTKELNIKIKLNEQLNGKLEVETENGFIDILTKNEIIEIKIGKLYKHALGQILAYGIYYPKRKKVIYLFDLPENINVKKIKKLYEIYDVELRIIDDSFIDKN